MPKHPEMTHAFEIGQNVWLIHYDYTDSPYIMNQPIEDITESAFPGHAPTFWFDDIPKGVGRRFDIPMSRVYPCEELALLALIQCLIDDMNEIVKRIEDTRGELHRLIKSTRILVEPGPDTQMEIES